MDRCVIASCLDNRSNIAHRQISEQACLLPWLKTQALCLHAFSQTRPDNQHRRTSLWLSLLDARRRAMKLNALLAEGLDPHEVRERSLEEKAKDIALERQKSERKICTFEKQMTTL